MRKIEFKVVGNCNICTSHKVDNTGYFKVVFNGKRMGMHRYIWIQKHGPITKLVYSPDHPVSSTGAQIAHA